MSLFRKSMFGKYLAPTFAGVLAVVSSVGCGSSTANNDQGTSFLARGYFLNSTGTQGLSAVFAPLFTDTNDFVLDVQDSSSGTTTRQIVNGDGKTLVVYLGVENRLRTQFVRVTKIDCSYEVQGAASGFQIPDDSFLIGTVVDAAPSISGPSIVPQAGQGSTSGSTGSTGSGGSGSTTNGGSNTGTRSYMGFQILSPDIYAYLNVNRNSLPDLPFRLIATCSATGVTQAGDVYTTNPLSLQIQFYDVGECCTANGTTDPGFQNGAGSGGNFDSFSGPDTGASSGIDSTTPGDADATSGTGG